MPMTASAQPITIDRIAALVEAQVVTVSEINQMETIRFFPRTAGQSDDDYRHSILESLIAQTLRYRDVERFGAQDISKDDIDGRLRQIESRFASPAEFAPAVQQAQLTMDEVRALIKRQLQVESYIQERFAPMIFVSSDEINTSLADHLDERTRLVWLESPTNPLLNVIDIRAAADAAHEVGAVVVVDNTFASPYLQQPLELGADIVLHSTTKYLSGHSDVVGGFVATNDPTIAERLYFLQKSLGAIPGPFDCWLVLRGIKTLAVRMRQHCENARRVAAFLDSHQSVERVLYPGLESHPGHEIAARQMRDFGGMISFLAASEEEAVELVARTAIWKLAESLGGVESLIEHPARMTHASTADAPFAAPRNLVRLSVGIESVDDLIADLEAALVRSAAAAGA